MASFKNLISTTSAQISSGGTITGDLVINGDLQVDGGGSLSFDEIIQGTQVIDVTNTEALLVRKNDDGGDVFVVDTTNSGVGINTSAGGWGLNIKGSDANVFKVQASDGNTLSFLQGTNGDATQKWFADGNVTKVLINTNGDSYFTGGSLGIGTASPTMSLEISNTSFGDQLRLHRSSVASGGFLTLSANDSAGNIHDYAKLGTVVESSTNGSEDGALVFQTSLDGTLTEYLRVTSAGNVGIGTDSPRKIFHSYSSTGVNIVGLFESSDNQALIAFRDNTTGDDNHVMIGANGTSFAISTDNTERMVIDSSGNVTVNSGSAIQFGDSSYKIIGSTAGNYLRFYTESTQALEINDSQNATFAGNVTVNGDTLSLVKSNNNAFLKIESTDGGEAIFEMRATTNRTNQIRFFEGATQRGSIVYAHASQSLTFNTGDSATAKLVLDDNSRISLSNNDSGTGNTIFGYKAGNAITTGHNNVVMGNNALLNSQDIGFAVAIGNSAMASGNMTSGADGTVAIGKSALTNLTTGANNVAVGANALDELSTGGYNTAIGVNALHQVDNGESENVAIGYNAGSNLDGDGGTASGNVCIGSNAIPSSSGGLNQIVIGKDTTGRGNNSVTIGNSSITNNYFTGSLSVGDTSPDATLTINQGANDTAIFSLKSSDVGHAVTGIAETDTFLTISKATADQGGALITAITDESTSAEYALALRGILGGDNPDDSDPAIQFISAKRSGTGIADVGSSETAFRFSDSDVTTHYLTITGNGTVSGDLNDTSDISLKENISPLSTALDLVEKMNPVSFDWKDKNKGSNSGFIAQEIEAILPNDVAGNDYVEGKNMGKSVNVTGIVAHLVKAVQELSARVKELENN